MAACKLGRPRSASRRCKSSAMFMKKLHHVLGLAAELRAQLWLLCRDACRTGVEMALARHVAAQRNQHSGTERKFVSAEQRGDENVAGGGEPAIGAQTHAATQSIGAQNLLRLAKAKLPGISGVLDAAQRRRAGAAAVSGDNDVVGVRLGDARGNRAHAQSAIPVSRRRARAG